MKIDFSAGKNHLNITKHGLSLADAAKLDLLTAVVIVDLRRDYGEVRYRALGRIDGQGYHLAFTIRGTTLWPISFRRAHEKEMRRHGL